MLNISNFGKKKIKLKSTLVSCSDISRFITIKAKIALMPVTIHWCFAVQWISVEFLSDAVQRKGSAANSEHDGGGAPPTCDAAAFFSLLEFKPNISWRSLS